MGLNPYAWPGIVGAPFPGQLPVMPLSGQVLLPLATFTDSQVFSVGADFGKLLQATGTTISATFSISAYVIEGTDPSPGSHFIGTASVINGAAPPIGTGWALSAVSQKWGPGIAGVTYGFVASATLSDGTVITQGSQGTCIATDQGAEA